MSSLQYIAISLPPVHPELRAYIKRYHFTEMKPPLPAFQKVPASSKCILGIPYGDTLQIQLKGVTHFIHQPFFLGMASQSYQYINAKTGNYKCLFVEFNDIGFFALFRENTEQFVDTVVLLENIVASAKLHGLQSMLADRLDISDKIAGFEQFLLQFLPDSRTRFRLERYERAISLIRASKGLLNVKDLAAEFCLSERQFRRIITEIKGCSPKDFARLIRFTNIFSDIMLQRGDINWAAIAYQYKFYDQMHFIRDFRHFSQYNPTQFPKDKFLFSSSLTLPALQADLAMEKEEIGEDLS